MVRYNDKLKATDEKLIRAAGSLEADFDQRFEPLGDARFRTPGSSRICYELARVITLGALNRNESRGALQAGVSDRRRRGIRKTTIAEYSAEAPVFARPIDVSLVEPQSGL